MVVAWKPGTGGQAGYAGEMPDQDVPEDQEGAPVAPSAPDISQFGKIGGYENVGFHGQGGKSLAIVQIYKSKEVDRERN